MIALASNILLISKSSNLNCDCTAAADFYRQDWLITPQTTNLGERCSVIPCDANTLACISNVVGLPVRIPRGGPPLGVIFVCIRELVKLSYEQPPWLLSPSVVWSRAVIRTDAGSGKSTASR